MESQATFCCKIRIEQQFRIVNYIRSISELSLHSAFCHQVQIKFRLYCVHKGSDPEHTDPAGYYAQENKRDKAHRNVEQSSLVAAHEKPAFSEQLRHRAGRKVPHQIVGLGVDQSQHRDNDQRRRKAEQRNRQRIHRIRRQRERSGIHVGGEGLQIHFFHRRVEPHCENVSGHRGQQIDEGQDKGKPGAGFCPAGECIKKIADSDGASAVKFQKQILDTCVDHTGQYTAEYGKQKKENRLQREGVGKEGGDGGCLANDKGKSEVDGGHTDKFSHNGHYAHFCGIFQL